MNLGNFSFHERAEHIEQFWVMDQDKTHHIDVDGKFTYSSILLPLVLLTFMLLSLPANIAIFTVLFRHGIIKDRPINLLILVDQLINSIQRYQISAFYQYHYITNGKGVLGTEFCLYLQVVNQFGVLNTSLGSLPIAIFRLIALNKPMNPRVERVLGTCLLVVCLTVNTFMTIIIRLAKK